MSSINGLYLLPLILPALALLWRLVASEVRVWRDEWRERV